MARAVCHYNASTACGRYLQISEWNMQIPCGGFNIYNGGIVRSEVNIRTWFVIGKQYRRTQSRRSNTLSNGGAPGVPVLLSYESQTSPRC